MTYTTFHSDLIENEPTSQNKLEQIISKTECMECFNGINECTTRQERVSIITNAIAIMESKEAERRLERVALTIAPPLPMTSGITHNTRLKTAHSSCRNLNRLGELRTIGSPPFRSFYSFNHGLAHTNPQSINADQVATLNHFKTCLTTITITPMRI